MDNLFETEHYRIKYLVKQRYKYRTCTVWIKYDNKWQVLEQLKSNISLTDSKISLGPRHGIVKIIALYTTFWVVIKRLAQY